VGFLAGPVPGEVPDGALPSPCCTAPGHACLAIFHGDPKGFYAGLVLIALGSGGIKPCVSALVADQFTAENKHLVNKVFAIFYWSINLGSFFASLVIPKTLRLFGRRWRSASRGS